MLCKMFTFWYLSFLGRKNKRAARPVLAADPGECLIGFRVSLCAVAELALRRPWGRAALEGTPTPTDLEVFYSPSVVRV